MKHEIDRREFLKRVGAASALVGTTAVLTNCAGGVGADKMQQAITGTTPSGEKPYGNMEYRTNRRGDDKVSLLGYGMMRLPQLPNGQQRPDGCDLDQEQINHLVKFAMDHGINYYDTSPAYCKGFSEEATGKALVATGRPRSSYYIATKLSNFAPQQQSREASQQMLRDSLRYLQTDYIDYLLLHSIGGGGMANFNQRYMDNGILDWLFEQNEKGVIRNMGFSFHGDVDVFDQMLKWDDEGRYKWDFVQIQMNYVDWRGNNEPGARGTAEYLYHELEKRGIPAVIMEPLLGGRLVKLPTHIVNHLKEARSDSSVASWAFRFLGTHPRIAVILSGMSEMEHLTDNIKTFSNFKPCTEEELEFLKGIGEKIMKYPVIECTGCQYCMPCPYGIDIPGIFKFYNKEVNAGTYVTSKEQENYARARRKYLLAYNKAIPTIRQADHCISCGKCTKRCPQQIFIPRQLRRINDYIEKLKQETI